MKRLLLSAFGLPSAHSGALEGPSPRPPTRVPTPGHLTLMVRGGCRASEGLGEGRRVWREGQTVRTQARGPYAFEGSGALPCPPGREAVNAEAIVRLGGAERGKGAGI